MPYGQRVAAVSRTAERRKREDAAERLQAVVPRLQTLELAITEVASMATVRHVKYIMVDTAPALFELVCGDPRCVEGGHDISAPVLAALRAIAAKHEGEHQCSGTIGGVPCTRRLSFKLSATYARA